MAMTKMDMRHARKLASLVKLLKHPLEDDVSALLEAKARDAVLERLGWSVVQ
jgi:hypothetical protein